MTQGQGEIAPVYCPRCGGRMQKPAGSSLYWHADNNHPRCDITNIVDTALEVATPPAPETPPDPPAPKKARPRK